MLSKWFFAAPDESAFAWLVIYDSSTTTAGSAGLSSTRTAPTSSPVTPRAWS